MTPKGSAWYTLLEAERGYMKSDTQKVSGQRYGIRTATNIEWWQIYQRTRIFRILELVFHNL